VEVNPVAVARAVNAIAAASHATAKAKPRLSHARFPLRSLLRLTSSIMLSTELSYNEKVKRS